jgi:hypothetical protein
MRATLFFIFLAAITGWTSGQILPDNTAPGTITGVVVDAQTSQPISGARVTVRQRRAVTDRAGAFRLDQVPPGKYVLNVEADDFRVVGVLPTIDVASEQIVEGIRVALQRTGVISGRAFDENGEPMANMTAELFNWREADTRIWMLRPLAFKSSVTNDRGEFRIIGIDPGNYFIRIKPASGSKYPGTFYPNTTDAATAAKITVSGGDEISGTDVRLAPVGIRLRGRFVTPQDSSGPVRVELYRRNLALPVAPISIETTRQAFDISGVPPGSYYLYAITRVTPLLNSPIPGWDGPEYRSRSARKTSMI